MKFKIKIKADGVIARLKELGRSLDDLSDPLNESGAYMERETRLNFIKQQSPDGQAWAALAPSTLARKRTGSILRETGSLFGGIAASPASANEVKVASTGGAYGIYHQKGTSKMPRREFIGIGARHKPEINRIFQTYIGGLLG